MLPIPSLNSGRRAFSLSLGVGLLLGAALLLSASAASGQSHPDSSGLHRRARQAQREFERLHRQNLPRGQRAGPAGCVETLGRLCLREEEEGWTPVPEASSVVAARNALLGILGEVGGDLPGDRWVLGQRIRYLGHSGRWREALDVALGCSGSPVWWCSALKGYVLHRSGDVLGSLESFSLALSQMEPEQAREWKDPEHLLEYPESRWIRDSGRLDRQDAIDRFWTLADPLFLTPGNERLSEHYARRFAPSLFHGSAQTMDLPWSGAFEKLLLRYGFIAGWERVPPGMHEPAGDNVVLHHHPEGRGLLPPVEVLEDPGGLEKGSWIPEDEGPRSASAPVNAPLIAEGLGQTAVFRRAGNLLVVAAYGPPVDTTFLRLRPPPGSVLAEGVGEEEPGGRPPWERPAADLGQDTLSGLFLVADAGRQAPYSAFGTGGEGVLQVSAPPGEYLLSLEQWNPAGKWGARIRHGIRAGSIPADVPAVSDLIVLDPALDLPQSLSEALPRILASTEFASRARITVAWEVYGLGLRREPLTFHLSLEKEGGNVFGSALRKLGLLRKDPALTLSWTEAGAEESGPHFRAVDVDLPLLESGFYALRLEMEIPRRSNVLSIRRIRILGPSSDPYSRLSSRVDDFPGHL